MHEVCTPHSIPRAWEQQGRGKRKRRNRQKNNARVARNLEETNVGTKGKYLKQDLTSAKDPTIELLEGRESPTID